MKGIAKRLIALFCALAMLSAAALAAGPGETGENGPDKTVVTETGAAQDGQGSGGDSDKVIPNPAPEGENQAPQKEVEPAEGENNEDGTTPAPGETVADEDEDKPAEPPKKEDTETGNEPAEEEPIEPINEGIETYAATGEGRATINWNAGWEYSEDAASADDSSADWEDVNLPHTWNAEDGADGGNDYRRAVSWYRKTLEWDDYADRDIYIEFLGAAMETEVFVNGQSVGASHRGGYTAFRYDLTNKLTADQDNVIAVKVSNESQPDLLPRGGDFTIFGGIYRDVNLIVADKVHLALDDYGSSGVYLTPTVDGTTGKLDIRAKLTGNTAGVSVKATIREPDGFTGISAIANPYFDASGTNMGDDSTKGTVTLTEGESDEWTGNMNVANVHLWDGLSDPFRYIVDVEVLDGESNVIDSVSQYIGFRTYEVTADGFFLNGKLYPLRGVSRHQDGYNVAGAYLANALTNAEHERDLGLIYEMGANYVRLAHYPQAPYFYELCDKYGLVVWAEIPMVGGVPAANQLEQYGDKFKANAKLQLVEMIRQNYNHPSICFWGVTNEISEVSGTTFVKDLIAEQNATAHREDPTRLTTYAAERNGDGTWDTDVIGWNIYPNWYYEDTLTNMMNVRRGELSGNKPIGISEYGAGANIEQHENSPVFSIGQSRGQWHPEEYQGIWHEGVLKEINDMPSLWSTAVWNMFDFGSDSRDEGGKTGVNDKGLVTMDRQTKKDAFYLYKANWNQRDKFAHINSSRYTPREESIITVRAYSNCGELTLDVNGTDYGPAQNNGVGVFEWENVALSLSSNTATVTGTGSDTGITDTVTWVRRKGSTPQLANSAPDKLTVDNTNSVITLKDAVTVAQLKAAVTGMNGTTWTLLGADGAEVTDNTADVTTNMTIRAVSEDESTTKTYTFSIPNLAAGKSVTAATQLGQFPASNAVDLNGGTYWSSDRGTRSSITVDLGADYNLNNVIIDWYNNGMNPRTYKYTVQLSQDNENFTVVDDRSNNDIAVDTTSRHAKITSTLDPAEAYGRYVKINITGGPGWSDCCEISEITVNGWRLTSSNPAYQVDEARRRIAVPRPASANDFPWGTLSAALNTEGTHLSAGEHNTSAYFVLEGDQWKVTDSDGNDTFYTVRFADSIRDVTGVTVQPGSLQIAAGGSSQLSAVVQPGDAENKTVLWSTSDETVASVDAAGRVTALTAGTATITATTQDGGFTAQCVVTVAESGTPGSSSGSTGSSSRPFRPSSSSSDRDTAPSKPKQDEPKEAAEPAQPSVPAGPSTPAASSRFTDVPAGEWYTNAVQYAVETGMMQGNGSAFSPNDRLTRGMFAQTVANLDGASGSAASQSFSDVRASDWYAGAVAWAVSRNYMSGYSGGRFGPGDAITREQLAAVLYSYAKAKGYDLSASGEISSFADGGSVSGWAEAAVRWAIGSGLLSGKSGGRLDPSGTATRAEVAQILMNFRQNVMK